MNHFNIVYEYQEKRIFSAVVYAKALNRKIKLALVQYFEQGNPKIKATKIYFSTDLEISA